MAVFNCRLLLVLVAICLSFASSVRGEEVDLEIVFAVDGSGSISKDELKLQLAGYAAAFRDPAIQAATLSGPLGKVAVAMVIWSDAAFPKFPTEWHVIETPNDALRFAGVIQDFYQHSGREYGIGGGGTGIGDGVAYAMQMLSENIFTAQRQVIDVSGDGIETDPWFRKAVTLPDATKAAKRRGIIINGLAILSDFPRLDTWYRENVIQGHGSFVIEAEDFEVFGEAILKKLWREFSLQISWLDGFQPAQLALGRDINNTRRDRARFQGRPVLCACSYFSM